MNPLTLVYRDALSAIVGGLVARLLVAWLVLWDPGRPLWSAARAAELAATWTEGAQLAAAEQSAGWLGALTADAWRMPPARIARYGIPAGLVGMSAAGGPLSGLTGLAPAVFWSRLMGGASRADAAAAAAGWLGRIASSEPYRVANAVTAYNARHDPRLTGRSRRETRPGACSFCQMLAERGWTRAAGFPAHGHCGCTATPEIGSPR